MHKLNGITMKTGKPWIQTDEMLTDVTNTIIKITLFITVLVKHRIITHSFNRINILFLYYLSSIE